MVFLRRNFEFSGNVRNNGGEGFLLKLILIEVLLLLQKETQDHQTWSVAPLHISTPRSHKVTYRSLKFTGQTSLTMSDFDRVCCRNSTKSIACIMSKVTKSAQEVFG